jgi:hypothetical protein
MAYRIFISHSSHSDAAKEFTAELWRLLKKKKGFDVFLDSKEIQAAADWNKEIHQWLACCHAGVLLLTPESITRPWVLKEAAILTWRCSLHPDRFKLFPVLFDGVTDQALEQQKFGPLVISSKQKVAGATPEAIAEEIERVIGPLVETETPLDQVAAVLTDALDHAGQSTAEKLARKLGIDPTPWVSSQPAHLPREFLFLIAGRLVRESLGQYEGVYDLMKELAETMPREFAGRTLGIVAPYWVPADVAGTLCEIANREQRWALAMNGAYLGKFTFRMYLLRAFPMRGEFYRLVLPGGGSEAMIEETIEDIYTALEALWDEERDTLKEMLVSHSDPLFVVLPRELSDNEALSRLESEFPHLTFILNAGDDSGALDALAALPRVEALRPPLDIGREKKAYFDYVRAEGVLRRL